MGGAELEWALPRQCRVHGVNACVAMSCFATVVCGSYYLNCYLVYVVVSNHQCVLELFLFEE